MMTVLHSHFSLLHAAYELPCTYTCSPSLETSTARQITRHPDVVLIFRAMQKHPSRT
jgi:hypothetical protein